ncbi:MAG: beta-N-acetylhexosaminidase [Chloroflexi bacterium]|nr:beta-N-acetylhexosaminidase [Chloroflexota bacterium]
MVSTEVLVGQMMGVGFEGLTPPDYLLEWLRAGRVGTVILFARNISTPQQVAAMTRALHEAATYGVIISIDQEGGTVTRLREGFTEFPSAMALSSARNGEALAEDVGIAIAEELRALGIGWNYAPVVDLLYNLDNPSLSTRSYGRDPEQVAVMASAFARGVQRGGAAACAKHFPGLGNTAVDTHVDLPTLATPLEHVLAFDLIPYRAVIGAGIASIMATHTIYTALDPDYPATLSPIVAKRLLREELHFDGVISTDCMEMGAITRHYGAGESAVLAALAGMDSILFSHTRTVQEAAYAAVLDAVVSGRVPMDLVLDANRRMAALKARFSAPPGDLDVVRTPEHLRTAADAARAGLCVVKAGAALPVTGSVALVEFVSTLNSGIEEAGGLTGLGKALAARMPDARSMTLPPGTPLDAAETLVRAADTAVIAVRSAHLRPELIAAAQQLIGAARRSVVICLRSPYDAVVLSDADAILCTLGDTVPALEAAVAALAGDFQPTSQLPFELKAVT